MQLEDRHSDAIAHYQQFGFAHFKQVIPQSTIQDIKAFLVAEFEKLDAQCQQAYSISLYEADELARTFQGKLDRVTQAERFLFSGEFPTQVRLHPRVEQILHCSQLQDLARRILDCQTIFAHVPVMSRYIIPHYQTSGVPPHRDDQYNLHMSNFVTVWVPLVDINDECGGVNFYPQTAEARSLSSTVENKAENFWQAPISTDNLACEMPHLSMGDVLIFTPDVIHGSAANRAAHIRYSLDMRLFTERDTTSKFSLNLTTGERISPTEK